MIKINMHYCTGHKDMAVYKIRIIKPIIIIITSSSFNIILFGYTKLLNPKLFLLLDFSKRI